MHTQLPSEERCLSFWSEPSSTLFTLRIRAAKALVRLHRRHTGMSEPLLLCDAIRTEIFYTVSNII